MVVGAWVSATLCARPGGGAASQTRTRAAAGKWHHTGADLRAYATLQPCREARLPRAKPAQIRHEQRGGSVRRSMRVIPNLKLGAAAQQQVCGEKSTFHQYR